MGVQAPNSSINNSDVLTHSLSYWEKGFLVLCVGMSITGLVINGINAALLLLLVPFASSAKYKLNVWLTMFPTLLSLISSAGSIVMVKKGHFTAEFVHLSWISLVVAFVPLLYWVVNARAEIRVTRMAAGAP